MRQLQYDRSQKPVASDLDARLDKIRIRSQIWKCERDIPASRAGLWREQQTVAELLATQPGANISPSLERPGTPPLALSAQDSASCTTRMYVC